VRVDEANRKENWMSDCIHCDIHELLESRLHGNEVNLGEIAAKVTEVLADLILLAPPDERTTVLADVLANLGQFVLEKGEDARPQSDPRRH
jgi:hypothetical protein